MIFPLVIAGVVAVIYIVMGLYLSLSLQTSVHLALRSDAGQYSETIYKSQVVKLYETKKNNLGLNSIITICESKTYKINRFFNKKTTKEEKGRSYVIDEAEIVRKVSLAKEVL